ncbi:MAG: glycosyltransferase family 4 protein [Gaiellaceae bacterium]
MTSAAKRAPTVQPEAPPLRLAVDARVVQDAYHGIGRQTFELLRVLEARDDISLDLIHTLDPPGRLSLRYVPVEPGHLHLLESPVASSAQQLHWPRLLRRLEADVLLVPYHLAVPWFSRLPVACFVHDCIFEEDRRYAPSTRVSALYKLATRLAIARSSRILTVSEATRGALEHHYGLRIPAEGVIGNGVDPSFGRRIGAEELTRARQTLDLPRRYVLHVGAARPHKNRAVLVRALPHLLELEPTVHLVLAGASDDRFPDDVAPLVRELGVADRVHRIHDVPESLLPALYRAASCFAFPSKVEGFGLPVLEAMAARVPVVASDVPVLAEVMGNAGLLVDPDDEVAWAQALGRVIAEPQLARRLVRRGVTRAGRHTWEGAADRLVAALRETVDQRRPPPAGRVQTGLVAVASRYPSRAATGQEELDPHARKARLRLLAVGLGIGFLLLGSRVAFPPTPAIPGKNAHWALPGVLMVAGQPRDIDLVNLRDTLNIGGLIDVRPDASPLDAAVARSYGVAYLALAVAPGRAPDARQLRAAAHFMASRRHLGKAVIVYDEFGLDQAPATTALLLVLHGQRLTAALRSAFPSSGQPTPRQYASLQVVALWHHGAVPSGARARAYRSVARGRW